MIKILLTILLLTISNSALATSLDDLMKIQKKISDLDNLTLEDDNNISDLDNLTTSDLGSLTLEDDNKFLRKAYFCPTSNSGITWNHFIYNQKENGKPSLAYGRCHSGSKNYLEFKEAKLKKDLEFCYSIHKDYHPPEIGFYVLDSKTNKKVCLPNLNPYFREPFLNSGPINVDRKSGIFDIREIISQQKGKKDENNEDLQVKLQSIFGLISEDQYKTSLASTQKKENLPSLLKIDLFGIKLGDQISNYKLINKQLEPNYSYYFYNSKHQFLGEEGILLKAHTIGGNGLQEGDNGDGYVHNLYDIKRKGYTEIMTMLSKHDHSFVEPVTPNKNFENYIVKFDPITKQILAVMAKQKSTSKEDCEESNWKNTFEKFYINKMTEKNLFVLSEVVGMLRIFNKEPYSPNSTIEKNLVAGFGFTCVDQLFGKSRWMFLINLSDEPEYQDNLYSILLNQRNKTEKINKENLKKSEEYKGM